MQPHRLVGSVVHRALEPFHRQWQCDLRTKLGGLAERAAGQGLSRNTGGKAEVILDPSRGAGLPANRPCVEHQDCQALGCRVDGCRKSRRPSSNHGHVVNGRRVEVRCQAEAHASLSLARPLEHLATWADHQRQVGLGQPHLLHDVHTLDRADINAVMRVAVASEQALQAHELRRTRIAKQHRAGGRVDQSDAPQNERAHDDLTDLDAPEHQRAQMRRVEAVCFASRGPGTAQRQGRPPGELADLARELSAAKAGNQHLVTEWLRPHKVDCAVEHQPCSRLARSQAE